ncbi:ACP phosphodiesterase [Dysgonomonas sp. 25]|uniref:acyl carrier protein phosphodiesterase n=1 Tax=Dysgonomonas sp. 25 TaxID=2302933 RepID=UPI0013D4E970|nr:ACP phosphodiesterase [Dysgonomonas sp. 25]NDV68266.1 DUF479 domain-containing protein [Dysgonomonas sp. 25]
MNFLAHAYLSFGDDEFIVGNLVADMIRGKQMDAFPERIQAGIRLHRQIDAYTDSHPEVKRAKQIFTSSVGRYDNSFLDVSYDHFLALSAELEPQEGWEVYAGKCYQAIERYGETLPPKFCSMFMYMKSEDWLSNYGHLWMIERSFERLARRAKYLPDAANPFNDFQTHYEELEESFSRFFPDLMSFVKGYAPNT